MITFFSDYYMAAYTGSNLIKSLLVSPNTNSNVDQQCVMFRYRFTGDSMAHLNLSLHRENSMSTNIALQPTNTWKDFFYQSEERFDFVVVTLNQFMLGLGTGEAAAIDNITLTTGNCPQIGKYTVKNLSLHSPL